MNTYKFMNRELLEILEVPETSLEIARIIACNYWYFTSSAKIEYIGERNA